MTTTTASVRKGRERSCMQCGDTYRSIRSNSRYCSTPCRKKAWRGTAPTGGPNAGPKAYSPITKALQIAGYLGRVGPISSRDTSPAVYAMLVDPNKAYVELAYQFDRKGWGIVSREEFDSALRADGILGFNTRSEETLETNRFRARQRGRIARAA